jgi:glutathione S-transferase
MIGWHLRVRDLVKDMSEEQVKKMLEKVPLAEQKQKWATIAGKSFTEEQLADSRRRLQMSMQRQEERLRANRWLAGDGYSLADVNTYPMTARMPVLFADFVNERQTPRVMEWLAAMNERPAVKAALAMARYPAGEPLKRAMAAG